MKQMVPPRSLLSSFDSCMYICISLINNNQIIIYIIYYHYSHHHYCCYIPFISINIDIIQPEYGSTTPIYDPASPPAIRRLRYADADRLASDTRRRLGSTEVGHGQDGWRSWEFASNDDQGVTHTVMAMATSYNCGYFYGMRYILTDGVTC